jgi:hypothetical protein
VRGSTWKLGGARRDRTVDLLHAMQALSQLSYGPTEGRAFCSTRRQVSMKGGEYGLSAIA